MIEHAIVYEQPLNETMRVCLRLEQLFAQIDHQIADVSILGTRNVVAAIIQVLQVLDRPDLKAKLAKELIAQTNVLMRLENTSEIDQDKLRGLLKQLDELSRCFIESSGKIGQSLREIELLNNLRLHLTSPGGGCGFDMPVYHYWLHQPVEVHKQAIKTWLAEFENIRLATFLLLQLTRAGSKVQQRKVERGFYQELLDPQLNLRLIRVAIQQQLPTYPEISVGRHLLSIRFFSPTIHERSMQYLHDFDIWVSYCTL